MGPRNEKVVTRCKDRKKPVQQASKAQSYSRASIGIGWNQTRLDEEVQAKWSELEPGDPR